MTIFGVDVSRHQGPDLDWPKIKASGIDFAIARASLATTPDAMYQTNVGRAQAAGIPVVGAYHFLYPAGVVSPAEQARLFVQQIGHSGALLTVLDIEKDRGPSGEVHEPGIDEVRAFAAEFAQLTGGHQLILYAPAWYWKGTIADPPAADLGPLHASRYVAVAEDAAGHPIRMTAPEAFAKVPTGWWQASHGGWTDATILQFTSSGKVAGYGGPIDLNAFRGSLDELAGLAGSSGVGSPSTPSPTEHPAAHPIEHPGAGPQPGTQAFYTVLAGDTLTKIAAQHGFAPQGGVPAFKVLIDAFPENARYAANPNLIEPGDRVRVS